MRRSWAPGLEREERYGALWREMQVAADLQQPLADLVGALRDTAAIYRTALAELEARFDGAA